MERRIAYYTNQILSFMDTSSEVEPTEDSELFKPNENFQPGFITFNVTNLGSKLSFLYSPKTKYELHPGLTTVCNIPSEYFSISNIEINGDEIESSSIYSNVIDFVITKFGNNILMQRSTPPIKAVENFNLEKYMGKWYQVSRIPRPYELGCSQSAANYTLRSNYVKVYNECFNNDGTLIRDIEGRAYTTKEIGFLNVAFRRMKQTFAANYIVLETDYSNYALVGSIDMQTAYVLYRTQNISSKKLKKLKKNLTDRGYRNLQDN